MSACSARPAKGCNQPSPMVHPCMEPSCCHGQHQGGRGRMGFLIQDLGPLSLLSYQAGHAPSW